MRIVNNFFLRLAGSLFAGVLLVISLNSCSNNSDGASDTRSEVQSSDQSAKPQTAAAQVVKGEVLDLSCYLTDGSKGKGHMSCAQGCLDKGLPAGILGEDGNVYLLIENHQNAEAYNTAIQHAAEEVEIGGTVINRNGMLSLLVNEVKVES